MKNIFIMLLIIPVVGCAPEFYAPNRINIPELRNKGDIRVSAATGYLQFEALMAYAITNNIGIIGNYASYGQSTNSRGFQEAGGGGFEIGGGYFKSKGNFIFENYGTIGFGNFYNKKEFLSNAYPDDDGKLISDFTKISLQSSITFQHEYFSISGACRYTNLTYNDIQGNYSQYNINLGSYLRSNPIQGFIEPAIQIGAGYKNVRLNLQIQSSYHLGHMSNFYYNDYNLSAGIQLSFPAIGSKKKTDPDN